MLLLGRDGFVYLYDDGGVSPVLYLLTRRGFEDFCRRGLREEGGDARGLTALPVDYGAEPFRSLLENRGSLERLLAARDRLVGTQAAVFYSDDVLTLLRVGGDGGLDNLGYEPDELEDLEARIGRLRLEPVFTVRVCVDGVWVQSLVFVSEVGSLFFLDDEARFRFLSPDLYTFLVLGAARFRGGTLFPRGSFSRTAAGGKKIEAGARDSARSTLSGRPAYCPRGLRCERRVGSSLAAAFSPSLRLWRWFGGAWGWLAGCCRG